MSKSYSTVLPLYRHRGASSTKWTRFWYKCRLQPTRIKIAAVSGIVVLCFPIFLWTVGILWNIPRNPLDKVEPRHLGVNAGIANMQNAEVKKPIAAVIQEIRKSEAAAAAAPVPVKQEIEQKQPTQKSDIDPVQKLSQLTTSNERRDYVKQMMMWAWDAYANFTWGFQELQPISKRPHQGALFGGGKLGLTIIDSMDTLHMMGLHDRFDAGRKWVAENFEKKDFPNSISVFEWNIRYVGGLLSCYALTKDELFRQKAILAADVLMPAFGSSSGIPYGEVDGQSGAARGSGPGQSSILAEIGTLHLEFEYLSFITGNLVYAQKVKKARDALEAKPKPNGLYPSSIMADSPNSYVSGSIASLGALSDSFYEYLLKEWVISKKKDVQAKRMYDATVEAIEKILVKTSPSGLVYIGEQRDMSSDRSPTSPRMDCFACFAGGMFALQGHYEENATRKEHFINLGKEIGRTCREGYVKSPIGLGPETMLFNDAENDAKTGSSGYHQRPEAVETWYYLWRITKDQKYRDWAWDLVIALEKYCKTEAGYSGLVEVYNSQPPKDDVMQSFFLAETLKYLYLIFSPDEFFPLDQWVYTTEAHPLPVHDVVIM